MAMHDLARQGRSQQSCERKASTVVLPWAAGRNGSQRPEASAMHKVCHRRRGGTAPSGRGQRWAYDMYNPSYADC